MEHVEGKQLVKKDKTQVDADEVLADAEIIAFYFSGHWCGPCRRFTPLLAEAYNKMKETGCKIEVIFVTSDEDEDAMFEYMNESHGDWFAVPFGSTTIGDLRKTYSVTGIPDLIIVKKDGKLVTKNGRSDIESNGAQAYNSWTSEQPKRFCIII